MPDSFTSSRYPNVEQTLSNNAVQLYKQKRQFLADLRTLMNTSVAVLVGILYLRDVSIFLLILRVSFQFALGSPFSGQLRYVLTEEARKEQRWFFICTIFIVNSISALSHVYYGSYSASRAVDGQLHGSWSVQFIGERLPRGRLELLVFDSLICGLQILYFCLMCTTDDSEVLSGGVSSASLNDDSISSDLVSDGYDGHVFLLTLDVWASVSNSLRIERRQRDADEPAALASIRERALQGLYV
ncbi:hypothetical protein OY671_006325 [Metschnikowia pulcherrima]|nr:hypothetical protein OY671_006325 [Metschnikowia pulcherrima]